MLKERTQLYTISIHSAAERRRPPAENILEDRWLHKVFLLLHTPATWANWQLLVGVLVITFVIELVWLPLGPATFVAAGIYLAFSLGDWLLLWWLPRAGRSFGPVGAQLFVLTIPRFGAALLSAVIAAVGGVSIGLGVLLLLQLVGTVVYLWGSLREPFALGLTSLTLPLSHWPSHEPPLRLLHLSDLHIERLTGREATLLHLIEQIQPDLMVITGDYLNLS